MNLCDYHCKHKQMIMSIRAIYVVIKQLVRRYGSLYQLCLLICFFQNISQLGAAIDVCEMRTAALQRRCVAGLKQLNCHMFGLKQRPFECWQPSRPGSAVRGAVMLQVCWGERTRRGSGAAVSQGSGQDSSEGVLHPSIYAGWEHSDLIWWVDINNHKPSSVTLPHNTTLQLEIEHCEGEIIYWDTGIKDYCCVPISILSILSLST